MAKIAYIAMSADVIHSGHINIIEKGAELGDVVIGLLTDEAIASYKRLPLLNYEAREKIFSSLKHVTKVVKQDSLSYKENLRTLKPDYVVHGDDWRMGIQTNIRQEALDILAEYGGELIEVPYTSDVSATGLERKLRAFEATPDIRRGKLKALLKIKPYVRAIEASNGLAGLIVENAKIEDPSTGLPKEFDAMWVSSLCDSTFKGKPDTELVDLTSRMNTINEIMEVASKPIILDGDTGGKIEHFVYNIRSLERVGVSAIIVEDKIGLKQNSLFGTDRKQTLDEPHEFARKLQAGKKAQTTKEFMIFARLESLIAGLGIDDALERARIYLEEGMADGVMIHSKLKDGSEVIEWTQRFRTLYPEVPLIVVPTTYNHLTEEELAQIGANVIIYANHFLRSAYPAMYNTAIKILETGRSKEVDDVCLPISDVLRLIPSEPVAV
jgi:phosphoenolpyruvate phosphomutase